MEQINETNETVVHVGSIVPILANLEPNSQRTVLAGFRLAHLNRKLLVNGEAWMVAELFINESDISKIMARMVRVQPEEQCV